MTYPAHIMTAVFDEYTSIAWSPDSPYLRAYPHLIAFLPSCKEIKEADLVQAAHMAYGWMPTILEMNWSPSSTQLREGAGILQTARTRRTITAMDVARLAKLVNNSVVGASKLLHFAAPDVFPIWDSNVFRFRAGSRRAPYHYQLNSSALYITYMEEVHSLTKHDECATMVRHISTAIGYSVSAVRAIELAMFELGKSRPSNPTGSVDWLIAAIQGLPADQAVPLKTAGYNNYTTQKDHWLGWLDPASTTGTYPRASGASGGAKGVYNRIVEPKMLLWLISAAGVDQDMVAAAQAACDQTAPMPTRAAAIRKAVPWRVVEEALASR